MVEQLAATVVDGALVLIAGLCLLCGYRVIRGPTVPDRVVGLDTIATNVIAIAMLFALKTDRGLFVIVGGLGWDWMTRLAGLFITPIMLGAIFMVHLQHGWNSVNMGTGNMGKGMEFQFTLLMIALYFLFAGNAHVGHDGKRE